MSLKLEEWLPLWYQELRTDDLFLVNGLLFGLALVLILAVINNQVLDRIRACGLVYAVGCVGVVFWLVESPAPRFGYGFILILLCLVYAPLIVSLSDSIKLSSRYFILVAQILMEVWLLSILVQFPVSFWKQYFRIYKPYPVSESTAFNLLSQSSLLPVTGHL